MIGGVRSTIESERFEIGLFIAQEPTSGMELEATTAGFYTSPSDCRDYPRIQILAIRDEPQNQKLPLLILSPNQPAQCIQSKKADEQRGMFG
jgi:hypothetical protein